MARYVSPRYSKRGGGWGALGGLFKSIASKAAPVLMKHGKALASKLVDSAASKIGLDPGLTDVLKSGVHSVMDSGVSHLLGPDATDSPAAASGIHHHLYKCIKHTANHLKAGKIHPHPRCVRLHLIKTLNRR